MASLIVIVGSMLGFASGLFGWLVLDLSFLVALSIWIGSGPISALVAVAMTPAGPDTLSDTADCGLAKA